ncbi:hypothetical protein EVAR_66472_1 [Eumeta japonica]|uniref:Uncharacterized protein n=1 Tax=Eumeta variegata TaxID=151549 RepID=A0A4C2A1Z1_EUMVA|nr:hypothetical protein EVAR_66472_1 [Eumeta japonica]
MRWSSPPMNTRNPRGVTSVLPVSWSRFPYSSATTCVDGTCVYCACHFRYKNFGNKSMLTANPTGCPVSPPVPATRSDSHSIRVTQFIAVYRSTRVGAARVTRMQTGAFSDRPRQGRVALEEKVVIVELGPDAARTR